MSKGLRLHAADDTLRCQAPRGVLTEEVKARLKAEKIAILRSLSEQEEASSRWAEAVEEVARRWEAFKSAQGFAPWLDERLDDDLHSEVGEAIRHGDVERALTTTERWQGAWTEILARASRAVTKVRGLNGGDLGRLAGDLEAKEQAGKLTNADRLVLDAALAELRFRAAAADFESQGAPSVLKMFEEHTVGMPKVQVEVPAFFWSSKR